MSMKEKLAVTVLVTTLALFGLVIVLYRMIKDKNADYTQIVLNQHSSYDSRTIPYRRVVNSSMIMQRTQNLTYKFL